MTIQISKMSPTSSSLKEFARKNVYSINDLYMYTKNFKIALLFAATKLSENAIVAITECQELAK